MPDERYLEPEAETMSREGLDALQAEKLLELVGYAYEHSQLYRQLWQDNGVHPRDITSVADFRQRVPFISKDMVREFRDRTGDPFGGLLCVDPDDLQTVTASSGTTGDATFFAEVWQGTPIAPLPASYLRPLWMMGLRPGDRTIMPPTTFRGQQDLQNSLLGLVTIYVNTWFGNWNEVIEAIREHQPAYVPLLSPNFVELDHLAQKYDLREVFAGLKAASFAGEPLGAAMRRKATEEWGLNLFVYASAGDTGTAWECDQHDGYHLWEDELFPEVVDPLGSGPVPDGEVGELVSTSIDNPAAPLIRYRTDDLVRMSRETCGCGRTHARIWVLGRKGDETVVQGRAILPGEIWAAVETQPETETGLFQIIRPQRELDELRLRVGYDESRTRNVGDLGDRLRAAVHDAVGVEPVIELEPEEAMLARGSAAKIPRIAKS
jgi:phenylacetate-CoA ligase